MHSTVINNNNWPLREGKKGRKEGKEKERKKEGRKEKERKKDLGNLWHSILSNQF